MARFEIFEQWNIEISTKEMISNRQDEQIFRMPYRVIFSFDAPTWKSGFADFARLVFSRT
jgi:hypothetical protein